MGNSDIDSGQGQRPALASYEDLAQMIDVALLAPDLSEEAVSEACNRARRDRIGAVTLRPADVQLASEWLKGSGVTPVAVVSYPHGSATTAVKNYETRDLLQRGARAIETPINLGKLISRQFQYVEMELIQMAQECHRSNATLTLDIEWPSLAPDLRIIACKIARRSEVDKVRAVSTYGAGVPTPEDLRFLSERLGTLAALDAGAWVRTLEDAQQAHANGAVSFQTIDPAPILEAWREELKRREAVAQASKSPSAQPAT